MRAYWSETKLNGEALAPGMLCYIQDHTEEGLGKVATYGRSTDEILEKLARTNASAQTVIAQQRAPKPNTPAQPTTPAPRSTTRLDADQTMQAVQDLENPATAGNAIKRLIESETGISFDEIILNKFNRTCLNWEATHPDLFRHPANQKLIAEAAIRKANGLKNVTAEHLEAAYSELDAGGYLISETNHQTPAGELVNEPLNPSAEQTVEIPSPTPARPRTVAASSHRSTRIGTAQSAPSWKPKYTREQLIAMPLTQSRRLAETGDKDYTEACEYWWPSRPQARASA